MRRAGFDHFDQLLAAAANWRIASGAGAKQSRYSLTAKQTLALRPERIALTARKEGVLRSKVDTVNFLGEQTLLRIAVGAGRCMIVTASNVGGAAPEPLRREVGPI